MLGTLVGIGGGLFQFVREQVVKAIGMVTGFHSESIKFAREAGMSLQQANAYTKVLANRAAELGQKYGISAQAVQELDKNLQRATGRALMMSNQQADAMVAINKIVGDATAGRFTEEMMNRMGGQLDAVQGAIAKTYATAAKSGLNASKMAEKVAQNLGMANRLSFRDGVNGLIRMTALSEKLGINMQSVESAAGNFMELDKAIENAAKLQMLGGSSATMFGNPLTAAYEANYDPEAFAKRMSDSLASYAKFDTDKGYATINGMNMDFVRSIASAMGISADEAASMAKKQAEVRYKENTYGGMLDVMAGGDEQKRDMLLNKSSIQNGKLGMTDSKGEWKEMSYFQNTKEGQKELQQMQAVNGKSDTELLQMQATELVTINESIEGFWTSLQGHIARIVAETDIIPKIQELIRTYGAQGIEWVKKGVDWVLKELPGWRAKAKEWLEKARNHMDTIITVLKWGFGLWAAGKVFKFAKGAVKVGSNVAKGAKNALGKLKMPSGKVLGVSAVAGAIGMLGNYLTDKAVENKKIKKGSGIHQAAKAGSTALEYGAIGATIGSIVPVIGTTAGAVVGGLAGAVKGWYESQKDQYDSFGDFAIDKMKGIKDGVVKAGNAVGKWTIDAAKSVGSWAKNAWSSAKEGIKDFFGIGKDENGEERKSWFTREYERQKEIAAQSIELINKGFNNVKNVFGNIANAAKDKLGNVRNKIAEVGKSINNALGEAGSKIGAWSKKAWDKISGWFKGDDKKKVDEGAKPKKFATGGMVYGKSGVDTVKAYLTPGERVLTPEETKKYNSGLVRPKPTGGKEYIYKPGNTNTSNVNGNKITVSDFNVNVSGTIRVDAGNSSANIDAASLLRDASFMSQLKAMIKDSINSDMNGGRMMNDLATRRGQVTSVSSIGMI